jgi:hypothetical protein
MRTFLHNTQAPSPPRCAPASPHSHPRILIRPNAEDCLFEMVQANHPPSGTVYRQGGKIVLSLGVHEHWDSDSTKRYSRNLDPAKDQGIELIYLPLGDTANISTSTMGASMPAAQSAAVPIGPAVLPDKGLGAS